MLNTQASKQVELVGIRLRERTGVVTRNDHSFGLVNLEIERQYIKKLE